MFRRLLTPPEQSFFLMGPRGSGKSTWLRAHFPDAHVIDLLSEEKYQQLLANPALFADEVRALKAPTWVVVDEIQRLPQLLNEVHRCLEEKRLRFVLCGSSARKLRRAGVNLLAGRALHRAMHPFLPEEIGESFDLRQALQIGLLPVVWDSETRADTLSAYARFYLKEEIRAEALVRNLPGFARFLPIAALFHGQIINVSTIARDAGVARTTVSGYLDILEETLLCFRLPAYEARLRVRERKHPKWYWCDPGLVRAMKRSFGPVVPEERGALFEGLVAQVIRAYRDYRRICDEIYYWSPSGGAATEVDFLLKQENRFIAVEVKASGRFAESWCRGLRAASELKGLARRLIVYPRGPVLKTPDGIEILPFHEFSALLSTGALWQN
jgi:predicted AAA+ superfamily ATPase